MSLLHTDQPIRGDKDSPDRLKREGYASRIGTALLLPKESPGAVISLEGAWGYGKTSVINLINKYFDSLDPNDRPIVINFNPWLISGVDNLVQEFLVHLASSIDSADRPAQFEDAAKQLLSYSKVFTVMKYIPGAEPWATIIQNVIEGVGNAAEAVGKLKEHNIDASRDRVLKSLQELDKSIVIFIDDIDRLPPDEVFAMIRLVKAVADFPRVAYVLAYDESYINKALTRFGMNESNVYLDKIVQVRLHLPIIDASDIEILVNEELRKMPEEAFQDYFPEKNSQLAELYHSGIKFLLHSPRDVKRLFNRLYVTESTVRGEVVFSDLLGLETIALKAPSVYKHIRTNPSAYTGIVANFHILNEKPEEHIKKYSKDRAKALEEVPLEDRQAVLNLLENLFPVLDQHGVHGSQSYFAMRGRIAADDRLAIALTYGLPRKEVPSALIKSFIDIDEKRKTILDQICKDDLIDRFIELLHLSIKADGLTNINNLFDLLAELADSDHVAKLELRPRDTLGAGILRQLWWLVEKILKGRGHAERVECLKMLVSDFRKLSLGTFGFITCLEQHGFYNEADKISLDQQWCTEEELGDLKTVWLKSTEKCFIDKTFCSLNGNGTILYLLIRVDEEKAKMLCGTLMVTDDDFDCLVTSFGETGSDSINGRLSHVKPDFLASIGEVEKIRERAEKRLNSEKPITSELKAMLQSIIIGKKYYLIDASEGGPF